MVVTLTREEEKMLLNITSVANDNELVLHRNLYVSNRLLEKYGDNEPLCERLLTAWMRGYRIEKTKREMFREKFSELGNDNYGTFFKEGMIFVAELYKLDVYDKDDNGNVIEEVSKQ